MSGWEDVQTAAYRRLVSSQVLDPLVAAGVVGTDAVFAPWVFQGVYDVRPFRDVEGTGKSAVVVRMLGDWAANPHNTAKFPLLQVLVWADSSRTATGDLARRDAVSRANRVLDVIDGLFHDPGNVNHDWPGLYVISCLRRSRAATADIENGTMARGELVYELSI